MAEDCIALSVCWIDDGQACVPVTASAADLTSLEPVPPWRAPSMRFLELDLPAGCTLETLLASAQLGPLADRVSSGELGVAIYGREALPGTILRDGDRIELLGELLADPKLARRARVRRGPER